MFLRDFNDGTILEFEKRCKKKGFRSSPRYLISVSIEALEAWLPSAGDFVCK